MSPVLYTRRNLIVAAASTEKKPAKAKKEKAEESSIVGKAKLAALLKDQLKDFQKKDLEKIIDTMFSTIKDQITDGKRVQVLGFGSFEKKHRTARKGRNPSTREEIDIPEKDVPRFSPA